MFRQQAHINGGPGGPRQSYNGGGFGPNAPSQGPTGGGVFHSHQHRGPHVSHIVHERPMDYYGGPRRPMRRWNWWPNSWYGGGQRAIVGGNPYGRRVGVGGLFLSVIALMVLLPLLFSPGPMVAAAVGASMSATASLTSMLLAGLAVAATAVAGFFSVRFCCSKKAPDEGNQAMQFAETSLGNSHRTMADGGLLDANSFELGTDGALKARVHGAPLNLQGHQTHAWQPVQGKNPSTVNQQEVVPMGMGRK